MIGIHKIAFSHIYFPCSLSCKFAEGVSLSPGLVPLRLWEGMTTGPAGRLGKAAVKFREVLRVERVAKERTDSRSFYKAESTGLKISDLWQYQNQAQCVDFCCGWCHLSGQEEQKRMGQ